MKLIKYVSTMMWVMKNSATFDFCVMLTYYLMFVSDHKCFLFPATTAVTHDDKSKPDNTGIITANILFVPMFWYSMCIYFYHKFL